MMRDARRRARNQQRWMNAQRGITTTLPGGGVNFVPNPHLPQQRQAYEEAIGVQKSPSAQALEGVLKDLNLPQSPYAGGGPGQGYGGGGAVQTRRPERFSFAQRLQQRARASRFGLGLPGGGAGRMQRIVAQSRPGAEGLSGSLAGFVRRKMNESWRDPAIYGQYQSIVDEQRRQAQKRLQEDLARRGMLRSGIAAEQSRELGADYDRMLAGFLVDQYQKQQAAQLAAAQLGAGLQGTNLLDRYRWAALQQQGELSKAQLAAQLAQAAGAANAPFMGMGIPNPYQAQQYALRAAAQRGADFAGQQRADQLALLRALQAQAAQNTAVVGADARSGMQQAPQSAYEPIRSPAANRLPPPNFQIPEPGLVLV